MTDYRIYFGNGQVHPLPERTSMASAIKMLASLRALPSGGSCRLERYEAGSADDPGCWVAVREAAL